MIDRAPRNHRDYSERNEPQAKRSEKGYLKREDNLSLCNN